MSVKDLEVSFCTVTFNSEDKIVHLINNIISVTANLCKYSIYVVDNGSTDGTVDLVKKLLKNNVHIHLLIPSKNKGFGAGNNAVLNRLESKYHIVINPDVVIPSSVELLRMIKFMNNNPQVSLLSPKILNTDGTIQKLFKRNPTVLDLMIRFVSPNILKKRQAWFVHNETHYVAIGKIDHASGAFMLFRTDCFKNINGFDERYFMYMEDADITRKINQDGLAVFFPHAKIVHEWQRTSHKKIKFTMYTITSMVKYFNKWGWKLF